jgi:hypothetical protein
MIEVFVGDNIAILNDDDQEEETEDGEYIGNNMMAAGIEMHANAINTNDSLIATEYLRYEQRPHQVADDSVFQDVGADSESDKDDEDDDDEDDDDDYDDDGENDGFVDENGESAVSMGMKTKAMRAMMRKRMKNLKVLTRRMPQDTTTPTTVHTKLYSIIVTAHTCRCRPISTNMGVQFLVVGRPTSRCPKSRTVGTKKR